MRQRFRLRDCFKAAPGKLAARWPPSCARMDRRPSVWSAMAVYSERDRELPMEGVSVADHPLIQHKLSLIRDKARSTKTFRELLREIGMLLCYEVTRDLPLIDAEIETPLARAVTKRIAGKKLVIAPILRAGVSVAEGMLDLVPTARVAHIGLYREPETLTAVEYFFKAPVDLAERLIIVVVPVLATGNTAVAAVIRL